MINWDSTSWIFRFSRPMVTDRGLFRIDMLISQEVPLKSYVRRCVCFRNEEKSLSANFWILLCARGRKERNENGLTKNVEMTCVVRLHPRNETNLTARVTHPLSQSTPFLRSKIQATSSGFAFSIFSGPQRCTCRQQFHAIFKGFIRDWIMLMA